MGVPFGGYGRTVSEARADASTRQPSDVLRRQRIARWATAAGLAGAAGLTVILLSTVQGPTGSTPDAGRVPVSVRAPAGVAGGGGVGPAVTPAGGAPPAVEPPAVEPGTLVPVPAPPVKTPSSR